MVMPRLKKFGTRLAFEFFVENWRPRFVNELKKWLKRYSPDDIRDMVIQGKFPDTSELDFSAAADRIEHIEKITLLRLVEEYLLPARPDLIEAVQEMDVAGAEWLANLRLHLLDKIRNSAKPAERTAREDMVMATCDNCGKSWPVKKEEVEKIDKCPFCGAGSDEPAPE
jgi:predicted Zn-ribbon and HTH transcriptional regulator